MICCVLRNIFAAFRHSYIIIKTQSYEVGGVIRSISLLGAENAGKYVGQLNRDTLLFATSVACFESACERENFGLCLPINILLVFDA